MGEPSGNVLPMSPSPTLLLLALGAQADAPRWSEDVRPILAEHCFACHGPDEGTRSAGLRLDTEAGLRGLDGGPAAVDLDSPPDSELLFRVMSVEDFERMPPPEAGEGLDAAEIDVLRRWLEAGAEWEPHWAYRPLELELAPPPGEAHPVDAFVAARLAAEGHGLAGQAGPRELVRRVHLDLTGLPPDPAVVDAFVTDPSDDAYAALVDGLLSDVSHAEHWAQHWLDVARYADSHGYTIDGGRSIWPWRDWVIRSVHRDQPFDEFTLEQLAGDLLPDATRDQRVATGFHRNTQVNQEGGAKDEENRINALIDRVATTGTVWLGTTMGCAQCHTHKFDPITHTEYFGLFAFLNSTTDGGVTDAPRLLVPRSDAERSQVEEYEAREAELAQAHRRTVAAAHEGWTVWQPGRATGSNGPELRPEEDGSYRVLGQNPVYTTYVLDGEAPAGGVGTVRLEALPHHGPGRARGRIFLLQEVRAWTRSGESAEEEEWRPIELAGARASQAGSAAGEADGPREVPEVLDGDGDSAWTLPKNWPHPEVLEITLGDRLEAGSALRLELVQEAGGNRALGSFRVMLGAEATPAADALVSRERRDAWDALALQRRLRPSVPTTLVLEERATPRVTRRFERGSFLDQREPVTPHVPAALDHGGTAPPADRLDFARWLVAPANGLMRRVTVNRWWAQIMGQGLVSTVDDFGVRGARPSHPELLEWLSAEMLRQGDSRRAILRTLVLSRTYRQSRHGAPELAAADPENRLLGRARLRRLSGEAIRDAMLAASGRLVNEPFGPPVEPPQPTGVYAFTQARKNWTSPAGDGRARRSLYTRIWRSAAYPFFGTFDAPARDFSCTRRRTSRTPLQALSLANSPQVMELARSLVGRLDDEVGRDGDVTDEARIDAAFRWSLQRLPEDAERARLAAFVQDLRERDGERAAWIGVARALFNLGEFTHRP